MIFRHHRRVIRLYSLFALIDLALIVIALTDCLSAEEFAVRALPRGVWVLLILLFSPIGAIVWFVAGRPVRPVSLSNGSTWRPGAGFPENERPSRRGPVAPDDDPEFLRGLAASRKDDEQLLQKWEADLRRREEDLRRRQSGPDRPATTD
jgi:Phospholipase_D-nuclease N-terminal